MKDGLVALAPFHPGIPAAVIAAVKSRQADIVAGHFHPFSGRLLDQAGRERQAGGTMTDPAIAGMNWFVQGVTGTLPKS